MMMSNLKFFKIHKDVKIPGFATNGSACFDIYSYITNKNIHNKPNPRVVVYTIDNHKEERKVKMWVGNCVYEEFNHEDSYAFIDLHPGERALIPTGLIFDIPEGYSVRIHPRSSISLKKGLILGNSEGIIDSDYYHQTYIMYYNASADLIQIKHNERIAQGELVKTLDYSLEETTTQPEQTTERVGGFGSTGKV